ncbi:MAG: hypothetical protein AAFP19_19515, partial [Bacteroidota bacterium]
MKYLSTLCLSILLFPILHAQENLQLLFGDGDFSFEDHFFSSSQLSQSGEDLLFFGYESLGDDNLLVKFTPELTLLWTKKYSAIRPLSISHHLTKINENAYLIVNAASEHIVLYEIDGEGNIIWQKWYDNAAFFQYLNIAATTWFNDHLYILGKSTIGNSGPEGPLFLQKYTRGGDLVWSKHLLLRLPNVDPDAEILPILNRASNQLLPYGDNELCISSSILIENSISNPFLIRVDTAGQVLHANAFDHPSFEVGHVSSIMDNDDLLFTGSGNEDAFLMRTNQEGEFQWAYTYGTEATDGFSDIEVYENQLIGVGYSSYYPSTNINSFTTVIYRFSSNGDFLSADNIPNTSSPSSSTFIQFQDQYYIASKLEHDDFRSGINLTKVNPNGIYACEDSNPLPIEQSPVNNIINYEIDVIVEEDFDYFLDTSNFTL